jgi:hypothetical protein
VREVRAELADLPTEDVDDLTGGMEADLTELAAECGGDLAGRLGSPRLYAAELRAAAGLPERAAGAAPRRRPLGAAVAQGRASFTVLTEEHSWLRSVMAFLVSIRPAWWVLRGYLAAWALWSFLLGMRGVGPQSVIGLTLALAAIIISVQLGRGWLRHVAMTRPLLLLGNATAVLVMLIAATAGVASGEPSFSTATDSPPPGVSLDGEQVANIYPYDSEGRRITGIRLFAQNGRPLDADQEFIDANGNPAGLDVNGNPVRVVRDSSGAPQLNAYPRVLFGSDPWQVVDPANPQPNQRAWTPPMSIVPLAEAAVNPTPSATPKVTAIPTPTATPPAPAIAPTRPAAGPVPRATSKPVPSTSASQAPTVAR